MSGTADTLVIGASAAGLATAAELRRRGREFELVEAEDVVGASWRRHYDRLHLHTPKGFSALPGLPMRKSWPRYPARDQVVEYLELYQDHFALRPHFGEDVGNDDEQGDLAVRQRGDRNRSREGPGASSMAGNGSVPR
jgi:indole-3-pyruvate monooxygenase